LTDEPISERTVGPQLGEDNLRAGLNACFVGLVVVLVFLVGYYYLAGVVAFIAVIVNVVLILGVMAALNATFTLPGVAGIVLTIGAAVDANVLIFERLREEQQRGLSLRMALRNAYDRAWSAILDSNMTTLITSFVLYWLGTEEVKGFGITLLIGLISSMFTSLFVTKTIFGLLVDKAGLSNLGSLPLTFPKWDRLLRPNIDWMRLAPVFMLFSAVLTGVGCWAFVHYTRTGQMLDIEFASGTSVQFELKEPTKIEEVRRLIPAENRDLPAPSVVSVGSDDRSYEVITPSSDAPKVKAVILDSLGDRLNIERESKFDFVEAPVEDALAKVVIPIDPERVGDLKSATGGFVPSAWTSYRGGAAIVLKNLNPPLRPDQIRSRIERQRIQAQTGSAQQVYRDMVVETPSAPDKPSSLAIVLVSDPLLPYRQDPAKWRQEVAAPTWKLVCDAVNNPAKLQKVSNFDAQ
ncbi:MAG: SecD/SecF family protein translocase subunit, partial [Tepidisphaeraceae bacterium]